MEKIEAAKRELHTYIRECNKHINTLTMKLSHQVRSTYDLVHVIQVETPLMAGMEMELKDWACFSSAEDAHRIADRENARVRDQMRPGETTPSAHFRVVQKSTERVEDLILCKIDDLAKHPTFTPCLCFSGFSIKAL